MAISRSVLDFAKWKAVFVQPAPGNTGRNNTEECYASFLFDEKQMGAQSPPFYFR